MLCFFLHLQRNRCDILSLSVLFSHSHTFFITFSICPLRLFYQDRIPHERRRLFQRSLFAPRGSVCVFKEEKQDELINVGESRLKYRKKKNTFTTFPASLHTTLHCDSQ